MDMHKYMFNPKTKRLQNLAKLFPEVIIELERIFAKSSNIYIDWQNVIHWQDKLGWHINPRRLKHFLDSFDTINVVYVYTGTLDGDMKSQETITEFFELGYKVETKLVKIMSYPINFSSISKTSTFLLQPFVKKPLLSVLDIKSIESINSLLAYPLDTPYANLPCVICWTNLKNSLPRECDFRLLNLNTNSFR